MNTFAKLLVGASMLTGCSSTDPFNVPKEGADASPPLALDDTIVSNLFPTGTQPLHTPYRVGSEVQVTVTPASHTELLGWTLSSSDPGVLQVKSGFGGGGTTTTLAALHPGNANLVLLNAEGSAVLTEPVSVAAADQIKLYSVGGLLSGLSNSAAEVEQVSVLIGGKATFLVRYFAKGTELFGSGGLEPTGPDSVGLDATSLATSPARDFLFVSPTGPASASASLSVNGVALRALPVLPVPLDAVTHVSIETQSLDGDVGVLYAHATTASSDVVYGASFDWQAGGQSVNKTQYDPIGDPPDLFVYTAKQGGSTQVTASFEKLTASSTVPGQTLIVTSTAYVPHLTSASGSCAVAAPGERAMGMGPWLLGVVGVFARLRRRRGQALRR